MRSLSVHRNLERKPRFGASEPACENPRLGAFLAVAGVLRLGIWIVETPITMQRRTNAFYIQSPRLQTALPVSRRNVLNRPRTSILPLSICSKHCLSVRLREIRRQEFFNGASLLLK